MAHSETSTQPSAGPDAVGPPRSRGKMLFRIVFTLAVLIGMGGWYLSEIIWGFPRWPSVFTGCAVVVVAYLLLLGLVFGVKQLLPANK